MVDFAKYAFNKSHAACYALIAMQTAWLKYYYPTEFAAALCTSVIDNAKKLVAYMQAYRQEGMEFLPPDVNRSGARFLPEDGAVRFGLGGVKGVGFKLMEQFLAARPEGGFSSAAEAAEAILDGGGSAKCLESLSNAGAFSCFGGTRRQYAKALPGYVKSLAKDRRENTPGQMSMFDMPGAEDAVSKRLFLPSVGEYDEKELLAKEKESLGVYVTSHPLEGDKDVIRKHGDTTTQDLAKDEETGLAGVSEGADATICCLLKEKKIVYTKKDGLPMAFLTLEDLYGECEAVVFNRTYEECRQFLSEDEKLIVKGRVQFRDGEDTGKIVVDSITPFSGIKRTLWVAFGTMADYEEEMQALEATGTGKEKDDLALFVRDTKQWRVLRGRVDVDAVRKSFEDRYGAKNIAVTA